MSANPSGKPLVAMIALQKGALPDVTAVVEELGQRHPDEGPPADAARGMESAVFRWGAGPIAVALKSEPIPWEELQQPCENAWWWEQATETIQRHSAYLLVSLAPSSEDAVDRHLRLTRVVAAILPQCDAAGVYWPNGQIVHQPQSFQQQAAELSRESLNPGLWIDMHIAPTDDDGWCFYTTGLFAFGRREIEILRTGRKPEEIYEMCTEVIGYLLTSGEEVSDGGVIARSDDEQIAVRYGPSMFDDEAEVMQLEF
ncbi:MAG TPA: DUF4261 domain-containing protein [Pirellulaceae bacterium]|nr:DUF4261 domain-containing protein [Pirellulaceae bacterium]